MRRFLAFAAIFSVLILGACKKAEEKKEAAGGKPGVQKSDENFRPKPRNRKPEAKTPTAPPTSLKIFNDKNLVTDIDPNQYPSLATAKIKIGPKQHAAILLKDLLAKYKVVKGKNVILEGQEVSTPLTWDQAMGKDVYVYITPKKFLKVYSVTLVNKKFPKRVEKITVTSSEKTTT